MSQLSDETPRLVMPASWSDAQKKKSILSVLSAEKHGIPVKTCGVSKDSAPEMTPDTQRISDVPVDEIAERQAPSKSMSLVAGDVPPDTLKTRTVRISQIPDEVVPSTVQAERRSDASDTTTKVTHKGWLQDGHGESSEEYEARRSGHGRKSVSEPGERKRSLRQSKDDVRRSESTRPVAVDTAGSR